MPMQQNHMQNQHIMQTPPDVITTKDLLYLKDAMSWELGAVKKINHFVQECQNPKIKQVLERAGKLHQRHYNLLLRHCQNNNQQNMQQIPQAMMQQQNQQQYQQRQS